jgi:hemerythrin-like domain-containing protein
MVTGPLATMKAEHQEIEGGLLEILAGRVANAEVQDPEDARDAVKGILQIARQHLAMEESWYRMVEEILGTGHLNELGQQFTERRRAEPLACAFKGDQGRCGTLRKTTTARLPLALPRG